MTTELVASPLLIARRARSAGGTGGRRVTVAVCDDGSYLVRSEGDVSRSVAAAGPLQAVQAFNLAVREAARAGLASVPEPVELTVDALAAAERARA